MSTADSKLIATCNGCGKKFKVGSEYAGKKVRCKVCGHAFRIPGGAPARAVTTVPQQAAEQQDDDPFAALDALATYAESAPKIDLPPPPPIPRPQPTAVAPIAAPTAPAVAYGGARPGDAPARAPVSGTANRAGTGNSLGKSWGCWRVSG